MNLPNFIRAPLLRWAYNLMNSRSPDFTITPTSTPYLFRWHIIPRNKLFNIYLHRTIADDDDRALHDHPWLNLSIILEGGYNEHVYHSSLSSHPYIIQIRRWPGALIFRRSTTAHRLSLINFNPCISLFITGPRLRDWGFHCPQGWIHWKDFTGSHKGIIGKGCNQ